MPHTRLIVGVCLYGCNLDSPLRPYLDKVDHFYRHRHLDAIILPGGPTQQKSFPGKTEAAVASGYLVRKWEGAGDRGFWNSARYLDKDVYTTYDGIKSIARYIEQHIRTEFRPGERAEIVLFCEATRALKVALLARHFIGFPPENGGLPIRIETDSWELMHPAKELWATLQAWLAIRFPFLNTLQRWQRIRKSRTR